MSDPIIVMIQEVKTDMRRLEDKVDLILESKVNILLESKWKTAGATTVICALVTGVFQIALHLFR